MRVEVTSEHIMRGIPRDSYSCPIALALTEATGYCWTVTGANAFGWAPGNGGDREDVNCILSRVVGEAVRRFDAEGLMDPVVVEYEPAQKWIHDVG